MSDDLWTVRELRWSEPDARFYAVFRQGHETDDDTAIIRRYGNLGEIIHCERCDVTEDLAFKCVHLDQFKVQMYLDYDDNP